MAAMDKAVLRSLNHLYRLCLAGEHGFEVVAANLKNRGLKLVLKTYAQQRAQFTDELKGEIQRLGGAVSERGSVRAMIHRGRIHILATLTIGTQNVENLVLGETLLGEQAAVNAYRRVLAQALPAESRALVEGQFQQVQAARAQVSLLRGQAGQRVVVRLFNSAPDAEAALRALAEAGITPTHTEISDVKEVTRVYAGKGAPVSEVVLAGAVGGALWGSLAGALAGLSVVLVPRAEPIIGGSLAVTWAAIALGGIVLGVLMATFLGLFVGTGISEEDAYLYRDSLTHGVTLVRVSLDAGRAEQAARIMYQINAAARARTAEGSQEPPIGETSLP